MANVSAEKDPVMWVRESEWSDGIKVGSFMVPLDGGGPGAVYHSHPLEGEFPPIAEAGLRLQWMGQRWFKGSDWPVWTLCIYKASSRHDHALLHRGGIVLIKPARRGRLTWRFMGPEDFEWRQKQGSLLSVIRHAIELLKDK